MQKLQLFKENPIAVMDSGLGGISVLRELLKVLPDERYIYFGDSKNAPYGEKTNEALIALCREHVKRLLSMGAKCIVIACNTATAAAAEKLRAEYPKLPIIGMEPAVKPAAQSGGHPRVLVLATPLTIRGDRLHHLVENYDKNAEFILKEAPEIVRFVESGVCDKAPNEALHTYLSELLSEFCADAGNGQTPEPLQKKLPAANGIFPKQKVDGVVLGCTHFPFVKETIKSVLGYPVNVFDGAHGTAVQTKNRLAACGLLCEGKASFTASADAGEEAAERMILLNSDETKLPTAQMLLNL